MGGWLREEEEDEGLEREKRMAGGAKRERVPVPVLWMGEAGSMGCALNEVLGGWVPVWPMFTILEDVSDEVEVLILLVPCAFGRQGWRVWFDLFEYRHCLRST